MPKPYIPKDSFFYKAKEEGYNARSAFKLEEVQEKEKILKSGDTILDLGASPGSFLQFASKVIGERGKALGLDLQEIELNYLKNVDTEVCDIFDDTKVTILSENFLSAQRKQKFDVIISDLAPKTSGRKDVDQWKSIELNTQVLEIATKYLKINGHCLMKVFQGEDFDEFLRETKRKFENVKIMKPKAVRDRSKEVYLVCKKFIIN